MKFGQPMTMSYPTQHAFAFFDTMISMLFSFKTKLTPFEKRCQSVLN